MQDDLSRTAVLVVTDPQLSGQLQTVMEELDFRTRVIDGAEGPGAVAELAPAVVAVSCEDQMAFVHRLLDEDHLDEVTEVLLIGDSEQQQIALQDWLAQGRAFFLARPLDLGYVRQLLLDIRSDIDRSSSTPADRNQLDAVLDQFGLLRGSSSAMRKVYRLLRKVAPMDTSVLVCGESGTGKELVAESVHATSSRSDGPFLAVNCGAIPSELVESELFGHEKGSFSGAVSSHKGFFERASGGTLFLDEITEMPLDIQVKLLRVLETGRYRRVGGERDLASNVRIVAATNRSPEQAVSSGVLREDLYFRVARFVLRLPALRERGDDIVGLAKVFLAELNEANGTDFSMSADAETCLRQHAWPGNVRELKSAVEQAYLIADQVITPEELPDFTAMELDVDAGDYLRVSVGSSLDETERRLIFATLEAVDGSKPDAAEALGISLKTLYNRLNRYEQEAQG
ncbi:sigma-54-dependent transcriptional regulator [Pseudohalioglobus sediminis]|nr:sigma-54 dependent transcriptional regulator [Pseudohalioglobus sediminis]